MAKKTPGLRKRGQIWHIEKTVCGIKLCESAGTDDLKEAERYLSHRIKQIRDHVLYGERQAHNLDEACARYLLDNQQRRGIVRQAFALKPLVEWFGEIELSRVRAELFDDYIQHARQKRKVKATTLRREFGALRAVLSLAASAWRDESGHYWLDRIPALPRLMPDARKPRPIIQEEQTRLFKELPDYLANMALFAVNTGCRDQEICGLKWQYEHSLSGSRRSLFLIPGQTTKNGEDKIVPLNAIAESIIETQRGRSDEYVFTFEGRRLNRMTNRAWREARQRAGLQEVRVHDLRHTFALRLRALGIPQEDIADLLGHKSGSVTLHYSKVTIERLLECVDLLASQERKPELCLIRKHA
jgi:integrase